MGLEWYFLRQPNFMIGWAYDSSYFEKRFELFLGLVAIAIVSEE